MTEGSPFSCLPVGPSRQTLWFGLPAALPAAVCVAVVEVILVLEVDMGAGGVTEPATESADYVA